MKKVLSGGSVRAVTFSQADADLPDSTFFICKTRNDSPGNDESLIQARSASE